MTTPDQTAAAPPSEAVEAAARAEFKRAHASDDAHWAKLAAEDRELFIEMAATALAAALPHLREQIADEIEAAGRDCVQFLAGDETQLGRYRLVGAEDAYKDAVRVARGGSDADL